MESSSPTTEPKQTKKDNLIIQQKLAKGKFSVYRAYCPSRSVTYALKIFPRDLFGTLQYQKEKLLTKLNHPNVIKHIPIKCHTDKFFAMVTEYAPYGDFFEPVLKGALTNEVLARTYFHQLLEGLEYIHSQGIAHLDLKLENLMFGTDFTLKIIDFDQAQPSQDKCISSGGTLCYRAPEIAKGVCKDLPAADVYSAGVVLYTFLAREYPFLEANNQDQKEVIFYYTFVKNNDVFWKMKSDVQLNKHLFTAEFIELLNGMLEPEPTKRFKIKDIKESKWYNGPVLDKESLKIEMKTKWEIIMKKKNETERKTW